MEWLVLLVPATESPSMPPFLLSTTSVDEEHMVRERVGRRGEDTGKKTKTGKDSEVRKRKGREGEGEWGTAMKEYSSN